MRLIWLHFFFYTGAINMVIYPIGLLRIALLDVFIRNLRLNTLEAKNLRQKIASNSTSNSY